MKEHLAPGTGNIDHLADLDAAPSQLAAYGLDVIDAKRKVLAARRDVPCDLNQVDLLTAAAQPEPGEAEVGPRQWIETERLDVETPRPIQIIDVDGDVMDTAKHDAPIDRAGGADCNRDGTPTSDR